jgi:hypothetical protein
MSDNRDPISWADVDPEEDEMDFNEPLIDPVSFTKNKSENKTTADFQSSDGLKSMSDGTGDIGNDHSDDDDSDSDDDDSDRVDSDRVHNFIKKLI